MAIVNCAELLPFPTIEKSSLHELAFVASACILAAALADWQRQGHADHARIALARQTVHIMLDQDA